MNFKRKPKIAILSLRNSYTYGGVLSSLRIVHQFCANYFEPTVFFLGFEPEISTSIKRFKFTSQAQHLTYFGMNCIEIGARWAFWEPGHYAATLPHWKFFLDQFDYFFAVSATCIAAHPLALLNKKFGLLMSTTYTEDRTQRVKELHGMRALIDHYASKKMLEIERSILEKAGFIWVLSSYSQRKIEPLLPENHAPIIRCGHPIEFDQLPTLYPKKKEKIILAVGRYSDPRKNIDMLLKAFARIHAAIPEARLYVVGKKPEDFRLIPYQDTPSFEAITFTGQVGAQDLQGLYQRASVMLITSHQEGFGIAGLEALLYGVPVVATKCGGPEDYVIDNQTGFLVDLNNDAAMAQHALAVLSDPFLHTTLSTRAQQMVHNNFSTKKIYTHLQTGLEFVYPELRPWFNHCNAQQRSPIIPTPIAEKSYESFGY